ncbi:phage replisome organizer N-terminal domain-containing protein [Terrisporobacter hibernicus]|uniref:Phage replisome organizer N-terminal domain-containing protein n=1 Tax=Terrisporobacter hibernicus TaxID=2813371 RepID=A0AAX2ZFM4_9FIRM|nr:phage replisome organizer N-terminal domain-containing protein [Terrisporobacter hibernicus]UEL47545.1 phage replisome organizer N-terminal domain-containing protein [Terrisporobacter hibernicus]
MNTNDKYYLKLEEDFFNKEAILILEKRSNGFLYTDILIKLYLKSIKDNGRLFYKNIRPYDTNELAAITRHKEEVVNEALNIFIKLDLIEVSDDGAIVMKAMTKLK